METTGRCLLTVWHEVEEALEAIIDDYERVNHVISFFQDDRARRRGLEKTDAHIEVGLDLGSGPGNFTQMLHSRVEGFLVSLDYSDKMLSEGRERNRQENVGFIRAIFEALPLREDVVSLAAAAYSLRDSTDKARALMEIKHALRTGGSLLIIDIGKPNNPIVRRFLSLYMRYIVPILGGIISGHSHRNPWSLLYKTYDLLPVNRYLLRMMRRTLGQAEMEELAFGGLIVATGRNLPVRR